MLTLPRSQNVYRRKEKKEGRKEDKTQKAGGITEEKRLAFCLEMKILHLFVGSVKTTPTVSKFGNNPINKLLKLYRLLT